MATAKGLGGGFPIGAMLTVGPEVSALLGAGQHGTTFGGNPPATAAGLATVTVIEEDGLLAHARTVGAVLGEGLRAIDVLLRYWYDHNAKAMQQQVQLAPARLTTPGLDDNRGFEQRAG